MSDAVIRGVVRRLGFAEGSAPTSDAELLTRYTTERDAKAFAQLLRRHGPLVFGVCRRVLANRHDAEDAFQATFLVLSVKANRVQPPAAVVGWLHGVALRVAQKAKVAAARRWKREMASATKSSGCEPEATTCEAIELGVVIDEELARLPESLRHPLVLCDLGGKPRSEAARELACPEGTVAARLHRARKLLGERLTRRGVAFSAGLFASEAISAELAAATLTAAQALASGTASLSPAVRTLTEGVLRTMTARTFSLALGIVVVAGVLAGGWLWAANAPAPPVPIAPPIPAAVDPIVAVQLPNPAAATWRTKAVLSDMRDTTFSVAFSPDGKSFAAGGDWSGTGAEWYFPSLERRTLYTLDDIHTDPAAVAYSPDSQTRATTCRDGIYWSNKQGLLVLKSMEEKNSLPRAVAFGPYGEAVQGKRLNRLAYSNGRVLWVKTWYDDSPASTASFGPMNDAPPTLNPRPAAIAWSPSGKQLVFIPNNVIDPEFLRGQSKETKKATHWYALVWGAGSGAAMAPLAHGTMPVHGLAFAPDGKTLAVAVRHEESRTPYRVALLEVANGKRQHEFTEFPTTPRAVTFSPDGKTLIVGCSVLQAERPTDWNPNRDWSKVGSVHVITNAPLP